MSSFKIGNSKFSRFVNGKGFYIALAICLVAIGTAAYVAVNNSAGLISGGRTVSNSSSKGSAPSSSSIPTWDSSAAQTNVNVGGVPDKRNSSSSGKSSSSSKSSSSGKSSSAPSSSVPSKQASSTKLVFAMPVMGKVLEAYSADKPVYDVTMDDWRVHDGVDLAGTVGTAVKACASGTVSDIKIDDMLGQEVIINHGNGLESLYANLSTQVTVKKGQTIEVGDTIGCIGQTAQAEIAEAPHLHFEMLKNGSDIDPLAELGSNASDQD